VPQRRHTAAATAEAARLTVLAESDEKAFVALATEMLASGARPLREAALRALGEHPAPGCRASLRALFHELCADGPRRDQAATMRMQVVRILTEVGGAHDTDIAVRACDTSEVVLGDDTTRNLRALGLRLLARVNPELFPYIAVEHLDDRSDFNTEPANTAFQLLAATGFLPSVYQWLIGTGAYSSMAAELLPLLSEAPPEVVARYVRRSLQGAIRSGDDTLSIALADAIVQREMAESYPALGELMRAKISDELYNYLAVLLAGTNRPPLLAILERELHRGRRPKAVAEALAIRPTPESRAILERWEDGEPYEDGGDPA
jgi:hypothetical protein